MSWTFPKPASSIGMRCSSLSRCSFKASLQVSRSPSNAVRRCAFLIAQKSGWVHTWPAKSLRVGHTTVFKFRLHLSRIPNAGCNAGNDLWVNLKGMPGMTGSGGRQGNLPCLVLGSLQLFCVIVFLIGIIKTCRNCKTLTFMCWIACIKFPVLGICAVSAFASVAPCFCFCFGFLWSPNSAGIGGGIVHPLIKTNVRWRTGWNGVWSGNIADQQLVNSKSNTIWSLFWPVKSLFGVWRFFFVIFCVRGLDLMFILTLRDLIFFIVDFDLHHLLPAFLR